MQRRLAALVDAVVVARDRRAAAAGAERPEWLRHLDAVVDVLRTDHPGGAPDDGSEDDPLLGMAEVFELEPLDLDLLVAAAAPDLDASFASAFALLNGDVRATRPSIGLALELAGVPSLSAEGRARLGPLAPLRSGRLLHTDDDATFLRRPLRVADRVVAHLLGDPAADPTVAAMAIEAIAVELPQTAVVANALRHGARLSWLRSNLGGAGLALAAGAFSAIGARYVAVDLRRRPMTSSLPEALALAVREAGLLRAGLVLGGADVLDEEGDTLALQLLEDAPVPVIAVARKPWNAGWLRSLPFTMDAPPAALEVRESLWEATLGRRPHDESAWGELLTLRLTPEEIVQASGHAHVLARLDGREVTVDDVRDAVRRTGAAGLSAATLARTPASFDDLVLPEPTMASLQQLVAWAQHRDVVLSHVPSLAKGGKGGGVTALFAGSPGTGKTLAAHVVAGTLGLDLYTVDLSSVVDKYIGETEKNLEKVFREAESLNVVLFFDEADSLFGSRSEVRDSRDRYANLEVAYLLQRMEQFDGIALLATNLRGNLDTAFSRRLHFIVHFPDPDAETRRQLWQHHLSGLPGLDPADPVDVDALAESVELAGGEIRNIVLAAAYDATAAGEAVGARHVAASVVREYQKLGRRVPPQRLARTGH